VSLYKVQLNKSIHRGAIYCYLPVFWLTPPLWIIRSIQWTIPRTASLFKDSELNNSFSQGVQGNEEDVLARAKKRFIVVVSPDYRLSHLHDILVAPIYSLDGKGKTPEEIEIIKRAPDLFYLEYDVNYPEIKESFIDFKQIRPLHRDYFLQNAKLSFSFDSIAMDAILNRFLDYMSI